MDTLPALTTSAFPWSTLPYSLIYCTLINCCVFLDEYNNYITTSLKKDEEKLEQVSQRIQPFIDEVYTLFGNIKTVRNRALAHGFRDHSRTPLSNEQINEPFNEVMKMDIELYYQLSINLPVLSLRSRTLWGSSGRRTSPWTEHEKR